MNKGNIQPMQGMGGGFLSIGRGLALAAGLDLHLDPGQRGRRPQTRVSCPALILASSTFKGAC